MYHAAPRTHEAVILTAEYLNRRHAERALAVLHDQGYIDLKRSAILTRAERSEVTADGDNNFSVAEGAFAGGVLGALLGLGASVFGLPGVGLVLGLGPLGASLVGALAGSATGGISARLLSLGLDRLQLDIMKGALQRDRSLLVVETSRDHEPKVREHIKRFQGRLL